MKSDKKLLEVYNEAKGDNEYYQFERFKSDVKDFLKDIKNYKVICSMTVSRSGMTRHFNFDSYNMLLNICYNQKNNWGNVRVGGCGMDMLWHLLFSTCEKVETRGKLDKYYLNSRCSHQKIL